MPTLAEPASTARNRIAPARVVARAARALARGGLAVVIDEGGGAADVVGAGALVTAEAVNFMAREACGLVCVALSADQVDRLRLRPMAVAWDEPRKPFTVSVDARAGITTGISAAERAHTIRVAVAPTTVADDLVVPGHVFPLRAGRPTPDTALGRTEAAVELARLAGQGAGAGICEILDHDGELGDAAFARFFARRFHLPLVSAQEIALVARHAPLGLVLNTAGDDDGAPAERNLWEEAIALSLDAGAAAASYR